MNGRVPQPGTAAALIAGGLVFVSPLVGGGSPRLGTFLVELLAALAVAAAVLARRARGRDRLSPGPVTLSLLAFLAVSAFGLARAPYYHDAERCFLFIAAYVLLFVVAAGPEGHAAAGILAGLRVAALFQAALALWQFAREAGYQPRGTFYNPNFLAGFLALGAGVFLADALFEERRGGASRVDGRRFLALAGFALAAAAVVTTRSRGGVLALLLSVTFLVVARYGRKGLVPVAAAAAGLAILPNPFRDRLLSLSVSDVYAWSRFDIWRSALRIAGDHPLTGVGLGQYRFVAARYAFPVEEHWARYAKVAENPHSEPLMLAAELGLPGELALILFLASVAWLLVRARRRGFRAGDHWPLFVLAGGCFQALVDFSLHSPPVVLAMVGLLAAWVSTGRRRGWVPALVTLRARPLEVLGVLLIPVYLVVAARPLVGFHYFLAAGGVKGGLLDEKAALEAWRAGTSAAEEAALSAALFWDGTSAPYHSAMGSLAVKRYGATGDSAWLERAREELAAAMFLNANNCRYPAHAADLAFSLWRRGELGADGLEVWRDLMEKALSLCPFDVRQREGFASRALAAGMAEEAVRHYGKAVELEPCFLRARYGLGLALAGQGRVAEARAQLLETLGRAPACRDNRPEPGYEQSLVDLDLSLVHDALESLGPKIEEHTP